MNSLRNDDEDEETLMDLTSLSLTPPPTHGLTIFLLFIFHLLLILTKRFL